MQSILTIGLDIAKSVLQYREAFSHSVRSGRLIMPQNSQFRSKLDFLVFCSPFLPSFSLTVSATSWRLDLVTVSLRLEDLPLGSWHSANS